MTLFKTSAWKFVEFGEKTQNKGYYGVKGHSRSSRSVTMESPYAISLQRGHFAAKFQVEGIATHQSFLHG